MPKRIPVKVTTAGPQGQVSQVNTFNTVPRVGEMLRVGQNVWNVVAVVHYPVKEDFEIGTELIAQRVEEPEQQAPVAEPEAAQPTTRKSRRKSAKSN